MNNSLEDRAYEAIGPPGHINAEDKIPVEDILRLRSMGYSMQQVGDYYEVSRQTIWRIWKQAGFGMWAQVQAANEHRSIRDRLRQRGITEYRASRGAPRAKKVSGMADGDD